MPEVPPGQPPYWTSLPEPATRTGTRDTGAAPLLWDALPPPAAPAAPWDVQLSAPPRTFSALCAGALAAGALAVVLLVVERDLAGGSAYALLVAVLVALVALTTTTPHRVTNRWMAVVGLLLALAPLLPAVLLWLFLAFLFRNGLYG